MKYRNSWKTKNKQWDKVCIRTRIGAIDLLTIEIDVDRSFYMFSLFNFTIKNR
jgi:hypothetical protein